MDFQLDKLADQMRVALRDAGDGWHTRRELAAVLARERLHDKEIVALEYLVKAGEVEAQRVEGSGAIMQWEYRAKQKPE